MSTLWTPDGERPVNASENEPQAPAAGEDSQPTAEQIEELRSQLAATPASTIAANHCFGLFELAALHLSLSPPQFGEAQIAIDALGGHHRGTRRPSR